MTLELSTSIIKLNRVGATVAKRLSNLGIKNVADLINWFPFRYEDFRRIVPLKDLSEGDSITVRARINIISGKRSFRTRKFVTEALLTDDTGSVRAVWFNQPYIAKTLKAGDVIFLSGKVKTDMLGPEFINPTYEKETKNENTHTARLVPIYPLTAGLTQKQLRFLISQVIGLTDVIADWVPSEILEQYDLVPIGHALRGIHFPQDETDLKNSTDRLKFNELLLPQLKAEISRQSREAETAPAMEIREKEIKEFVANLPFQLTKTQKISAWEILKDLNRPVVMNRMLSGDVGSGKTIVSALALYNTVLNNLQGVLMAPTEILAKQHFDTLVKLLGSKLNIVLLSRSQYSSSKAPEKNKKQIIEMIKNGEANIVVGTHALLSEKVSMSNAGLVIVDEQHRFGVGQRKAIKDKTENISAHYLSMTATPIPRSLALMIYGDLDLSAINELPAGRKKIITRLVEPRNREKAYQFIRKQVKEGRQVFVICPLIMEVADNDFVPINYQVDLSGSGEKKTVMSEYTKLSKIIFPDLRVGYLHGKMKGPEKDNIMKRFKDREIDVLVSTSVVEVGVDIPNASVMMIEGADRFGLAQLHQFRGRVGRSVHQSYCLLFTDSSSVKSIERLTFFESHSDGFKLAEKDLETRGPGEVYGTAQSGLMNLRLAKLTDVETIKKTRLAAVKLAKQLDRFPLLKKKIKEWEISYHKE